MVFTKILLFLEIQNSFNTETDSHSMITNQRNTIKSKQTQGQTIAFKSLKI